MNPKNADETVSKIDSVIRVLSKATPHGNLLDQDDVNGLTKVNSEDQLKLADRLEDLIVLLKDEPDNKRKILESHDLIMDEFGHLGAIRDSMDSVKSFFLK